MEQIVIESFVQCYEVKEGDYNNSYQKDGYIIRSVSVMPLALNRYGKFVDGKIFVHYDKVTTLIKAEINN